MDIKGLIRPGRGAADLSPLLADGVAFGRAIAALAGRFAGTAIDKVACVEGLGFLVGGAVAGRLQTGLVPLRAGGRVKSAGEIVEVEYVDDSGRARRLAIARDLIAAGDRVLIVDDWVETGGTAGAAIDLIERCSATVAGIGALVDDTTPETFARLSRANYRAVTRTAPGDAF